MNHLIEKFINMLTAMAYAEAGDFDSVKQILRVESNKQEALETLASKKAVECTERSAQACPHQPVVPAM